MIENFSINIISASIFAIIFAISSTNIINAFLIEFESNELFLTSFDELQNIEFVINSLTNRAFKHRLILKNCIIIIVFINELFVFNFISIINSRYDDQEFKNILLNCDAANRFTKDIEQFKALQLINNVILNKKTIKSSIKFDIDDTLILKFVELNISLKIITLHIVEINISFLLCLNDLNRLSIYFNNLINEMIQKILNQIITNLQTD